MRHIAAYALLVLAGNNRPSAEQISKVVRDAGAEVDKAKIDQLIAALALKDLDFHEIIDLGLKTLGYSIQF